MKKTTTTKRRGRPSAPRNTADTRNKEFRLIGRYVARALRTKDGDVPFEQIYADACADLPALLATITKRPDPETRFALEIHQGEQLDRHKTAFLAGVFEVFEGMDQEKSEDDD